jgi:hypothetical protein
MILLLVLCAVLVLSASSYAYVGRSARRHHPETFEERRARQAVRVYPGWRATDRYL